MIYYGLASFPHGSCQAFFHYLIPYLLSNKDFEPDRDTFQRLTELTPRAVPVEASVMLYIFHIANREEGRDYVVLPNQNFNIFFGTTAFSQKWTVALAGKVIEKKYSEGVRKYRIMKGSLCDSCLIRGRNHALESIVAAEAELSQ